MNKEYIIDLVTNALQAFLEDPEKSRVILLDVISKYKDPIMDILVDVGLTPHNFMMKVTDVRIGIIKKYQKELNISVKEAIEILKSQDYKVAEVMKGIQRRLGD